MIRHFFSSSCSPVIATRRTIPRYLLPLQLGTLKETNAAERPQITDAEQLQPIHRLQVCPFLHEQEVLSVVYHGDFCCHMLPSKI